MEKGNGREGCGSRVAKLRLVACDGWIQVRYLEEWEEWEDGKKVRNEAPIKTRHSGSDFRGKKMVLR